MTLLAASIAVHDAAVLESALERAERAVRAGARLIEWRVDALAEQAKGIDAVANLVRDCPSPCIVTCRAEWEGGEYRGEESVRAALYEALVTGDVRPRYIDIELSAFERDPETWQTVREALRQNRGHELPTGLILSSHDFDRRPPDLLQRIERMTGDPLCSIIKIAWHARSLRDNLEAFDLLREIGGGHKPMIALCMGPFGLLSRVLAPKFGGFLTFASVQESEVTGPGQPTIDDLLKLYRFDRIGAQARVFGVIGWPVSHSLSPAIHNAGFEAIGFDGVYLPLPIPPEYEHFKATVGALIDHPGLNFRGASVTIPHKENLLRFVLERGGRCDALTQRIGAANTLMVGSAGGLECFNTDCPAAIDSLASGMGVHVRDLAEQRAAVIGAGGVARAVIAGLIDRGAKVTIFNRNAARAAALAAEMGAAAATQDSEQRFDIIINCTPAGMEGGPAPHELPEGLEARLPLDDSVTVFDTVYAPMRTPLIQEAEARGARVIHGIDMFIRQAAMQFERWTGVPGPEATFRRVLHQR